MSAADSYPAQDELEALGQQYMDDNPDMYDSADLEALGAAVYIEEAHQHDAKAIVDIVKYIFHNEDFHDQRFKFYKEGMGGEQFNEDIVGKFSDLLDDINEAKKAGAHSVVWESLYRKKDEDLREAYDIIEGMLEEIDELDHSHEGDIALGSGNINLGNQVLSEQPPDNVNLGNQVVVEYHQNWSSGESQPNSDELLEEWRNDENWETDF